MFPIYYVLALMDRQGERLFAESGQGTKGVHEAAGGLRTHFGHHVSLCGAQFGSSDVQQLA